MKVPLSPLDFLPPPDTSAWKPFPPIRKGSEIASSTYSLPPELVEGILHRGSKMVIGGGSKTNKTWTLIDLAISLSCGAPWLGLKTHKARVLYLNFEVREEFFFDRIKWVAAAKGFSPPGDLMIWTLRGFVDSHETFITRITEHLQEQGIQELDAIIVDPIYKLLGGGDENSARDMNQMLNSLESLSQTFNAAVIFAAHFSKGNQAGKESMDRISGSGVFARDPDAILTITKHQEEGAFVVESTLRYCKSISPIVVRWDAPLMHPAPELDPSDLKRPAKLDQKRFTKTDLLAFISEGETLTNAEWLRRSIDQGGPKSSKFNELLKQLIPDNVTKNADGSYTCRSKAFVLCPTKPTDT